jgi:hypothetical protein
MNENIESLPVKLQSEIISHPTYTYTRNDNPLYKQEYNNVVKNNINPLPKNLDAPNSFDGRIAWRGLITPPKNQGSCGSCWAFCSTSCLADKFNIQSMGQLNIDLSPAKLILCSQFNRRNNLINQEIDTSYKTNSACYGNTLVAAWNTLYLTGTNIENCVPYNKDYGLFKHLPGLGEFSSPNKMPSCIETTGPLSDMCADFSFNEFTSEITGTPARFYRCYHYYSIAGIKKDGGSEKLIRDNIYKWGPVTSAMKIYSDFYTFNSKNSIYKWNGTSPQVGSHGVEILGWGEDKNGDNKYWIIKNSWGVEWGDDGYFKISRGVNECELEENIITGMVDFFYPIDHIPEIIYNWSEPKKILEERREIVSNLNVIGGGIDPETGYSRSVMTSMPWIVFSSPIDISILPDYKKWVAGIDGVIVTKEKSLIHKEKEKNTYIYIICTISIVLVILLIINHLANN